MFAQLIAWLKSVIDLFKAFIAGFDKKYGFEDATL